MRSFDLNIQLRHLLWPLACKTLEDEFSRRALVTQDKGVLICMAMTPGTHQKHRRFPDLGTR